VPKATKDVALGLTKKGFQRRENDHSFFHLVVNGKKTVIYTKISHGEKEINDGLLGLMSRQVRLSRKQFNDLVDCPMTSDEYLRLLQKAGVVDPPKEPPKQGS